MLIKWESSKDALWGILVSKMVKNSNPRHHVRHLATWGMCVRVYVWQRCHANYTQGPSEPYLGPLTLSLLIPGAQLKKAQIFLRWAHHYPFLWPSWWARCWNGKYREWGFSVVHTCSWWPWRQCWELPESYTKIQDNPRSWAGSLARAEVSAGTGHLQKCTLL